VEQRDAFFIPLIVGEASGVFAGFCPSWFTVSSPFFHEQDAREGNIRRIRWGEAAATAIVMGTGLVISNITSSPWPFWISAGTCAVFIAGYEYMIRHPSSEDDTDPTFEPMKTALRWAGGP
jgi:hypothetical protein